MANNKVPPPHYVQNKNYKIYFNFIASIYYIFKKSDALHTIKKIFYFSTDTFFIHFSIAGGQYFGDEPYTGG